MTSARVQQEVDAPCAIVRHKIPQAVYYTFIGRDRFWPFNQDAGKYYNYKVKPNLYTSGSVHDRYHLYLIRQSYYLYFGY